MWSLEERALIHRDTLHRQAKQHRLALELRRPVHRHFGLALRLIQRLLPFERKNPMVSQPGRRYAGKVSEDACI